MIYRNTKTGAVVDSPCVISGGDWIGENVDDEKADDDIRLSEMTVAKLKEFAAELDIDLGEATKKDDIIKVIMESDAVEVE